MFALVQFTDNVYYVCRKANVKLVPHVSIKYKNGKRYAGRIITCDESYEALMILKEKIEEQENVHEETHLPIKDKSEDVEMDKTDFANKNMSKVAEDSETAKTVVQNENMPTVAKDNETAKTVVQNEDMPEVPEKSESYGALVIRKEKLAELENVHEETHVPIKDKSEDVEPDKTDSANKNMSEDAEDSEYAKTVIQNEDMPEVAENSEPSKSSDDSCYWKNYNLEVQCPRDNNNDNNKGHDNSLSNCLVFPFDDGDTSSNIYNELYIHENEEIIFSPDHCAPCVDSDVNSNNLLKNLTCINPDVPNFQSTRNEENCLFLEQLDLSQINNNVRETFANKRMEIEDTSFPPHMKARDIREDEDSDNESVVSSHNSSMSYVPETGSSDDDIEENVGNMKSLDTSKNANNSKTVHNDTSGFDTSIVTCDVGHTAPNNEDMFVKTVGSGARKDFCIYCKTQQAKLSRHLARKHADVKEVQSFLDIPKGHTKRKELIAKIRKQGHFFFNTNSGINTGELKVIRRPNMKVIKNATDYATCKLCKGTYSKSTLRRHYKRCNNPNILKSRTLMSSSRQIEGRIHSSACKVLRTRVFPTLTDDRVTRVIRYDELVINFANKLCEKYKDPRHFDMIRQKLRQLGRFLLELKNHNKEIDDFFSIFYPKNYDSCIIAIQSLAGLNTSGNGFKIPSLATALGTLLKQVGKQCISLWIRRQNKEKQAFAEDFVELITEDYSATIARTAIETQFKKKRQSKVVLPTASDIEKLQTFLRNHIEAARTSLEEKFSQKAWFKLAETCLVSIQIFNRRRAGEIERTLIEDFLSHEKISEKTIGDVFRKFSETEKKAASKYVRFTIRGKLGRSVPVLLHIETLESLKLLLNNRKCAKVHSKNPYLFGIPGTLKGDYRYLRACELMRKFSEECGAENPQTLRGTTLRKHIATMCVNLNLKDDEVSDLANFMGHADKIHKDHYRQPILSREILKVSKLLEAVQGTNEEENFDEDDVDDIHFEKTQSHEGDTSQSNPSLSPSSIEGSYSQPVINMDDRSSPIIHEPHKKNLKRSVSPFGKCSRTRWTEHEKNLVLQAFDSHIAARTLPSLEEIQKLKTSNPGILNRNSATIKTWIHNQYKGHRQ